MAQGHDSVDAMDGAAISRRHVIATAGALSALGVVTSFPGAASATSPTDRRLRTYEGKYAIDGHKVVDGYFAIPRGRTGMDVLVVIPGENGLDDSVQRRVGARPRQDGGHDRRQPRHTDRRFRRAYAAAEAARLRQRHCEDRGGLIADRVRRRRRRRDDSVEPS
jgi:hypothetical protein